MKRTMVFLTAVALMSSLASGGRAAGVQQGACAVEAGSQTTSASAAVRSANGDTLGRIVPIEGIEVSTTRVSDRAPLARTLVTREQLRALNIGQDTPMTLATLPGAYAYSDAGNGIGYSYLSIRGFPQRRISVLINGVPLNDPESHEVYWIDHPDLLSSTIEVQMQRGVGSALYGAASVGGSVNLETGPFSETPHTSALVAYGSFDTKRLMIEGGSGALANGWNLYGRYSRIETLGYRDQSFTKLWSYALSARRLLGRQSFRLNLYGGPEETHLAYLGVPAEYLNGEVTGDVERDRKFNPLTYPNERDHFFEPHYEFIHAWSPHEGLAFTQTLFFFDGKGYYDEKRDNVALADYRLTPWSTTDSTLFAPFYYDTIQTSDSTYVFRRDSSGRVRVVRLDVVRRRTIADRHYGWVPRLKIEHAGGAITIGGEIRAHDGRHWGEVLGGSGLSPGTTPDLKYYDYHPRTLAAGLFAREEYRVTPAWLATADLAWRHQSYHVRDDRFDGIRFDQHYDFAIPRLGVTFTPTARWRAFASWSHSLREPALRDLYDGEGPGNVPLYRVADLIRNVYRDPLIRPENVHDLELGSAWSGRGVSLAANLFRMDFREELVYAGQFNTDLGYPILGNAARSVHQGIEIAARVERRLARDLSGSLDANTTISDNHFVRYREHYGPTLTTNDSVVSYDGKAIGFFPALIVNLSGHLGWRGASVGAEVQNAGRMYLDNTESIASSIGPHTVMNLSLGVRAPFGENSAIELTARLMNALDTRYATSGYMDYDASGNLVPQFMPAATRNVLVQARVDF